MRPTIVIGMLLVCTYMYAQNDTVQLTTVTIMPDALDESKILAHTYHTQHLGTALSHNNIYIKNYGPTSLSTISLRGGNANQAQVRWEGIPITNPMLGLTDLSLLPTLSSYELQLTKGGHSTTHGSGAITGVLDYKSAKPTYEQYEINAELGLGSFGQKNLNLTLGQNWGKLVTRISGFYNHAQNDYPYAVADSTRRQQNADLLRYGIGFTSIYTPTTTDRFQADLWIQQTDRGIPPTIVQNRSVARQTDLNKRYKLSWRKSTTHATIQSYIAYLDEHNDYLDSIFGIDNHNRFDQYIAGTELNRRLGLIDLKADGTLTRTIGHSEAYDLDGQRLDVAALHGSATYTKAAYTAALALRQEWRSQSESPLLPAVMLKHAHRYITTIIKLTREFRAPTLNELFWQPGGNLDLLAEQGWNQELALSYTPEKNGLDYINIELFHRKLANWILWTPDSNTQFWSAYNLGQVRSYGSELSLQSTLTTGITQIRTKLLASYTLSKNQISIVLPRITAGDQLFYTPREKLVLDLTIARPKLKFGFIAEYTGKTLGINDKVPAYYLGHAQLSWTLNTKMQTRIQLDINNLFDKQYQIIERRPMPGRSYNLTFKSTIKK